MVLLDRGGRHPNEVQSRAKCVRRASLTLLLPLGLNNSCVAEEPANWGPFVRGEIIAAKRSNARSPH